MQKIKPFLWFDTQAEEAAKFYVSIFKDSRIEEVARYPKGTPGKEGSVMTVAFTLAGQPFTALNGGPEFTFNPAVSFVVECDDQAEIDEYWAKLTAGGKEVQCGWLADKYGLSWQIVPKELPELIAVDPDAVMGELMKMVKLDIAALRAAGMKK